MQQLTMTRNDLQNLTMKQIREYAIIKGATKVPKKWTDKPTALKWVEANIGFGASESTSKKKASKKVAAKKKTSKKVTAKKPTKKSSERKSREDKVAIARRFEMAYKLKKEPCTAMELKDAFGNEYKSVLDDLHAIRHNRNGEEYIKKDEVLLGVYVGRVKAFQIVDKKVQAKLEKEIKEEITLE